jgi:thioredoxin 1
MADAQATQMAHAQHLTVADFDAALEKAGDKPVMVDFFAEWCGPCKMAAPIIDELSGEYAGKAEVYKVDVDTEQEVAQRFGVMSIPTVIVFKNGEPVDTKIGFPGKDGYVQMLEKALAA